jgi:2-polyprenyl-3-methyl-5-hydroxy-6-metoxy-1,4-benzoquinol methylase
MFLQMEALQCPVCGNKIDKSSLHCRDYRVTGEVFNICTCANCSFAVTHTPPISAEIGKYYQTDDYVSHSETSRGIVNKLYHIVRKKTVKDKLKLVNGLSKTRADLLDVGCGTGYFLYVCRQDGWRVEGVELSDSARKKAEERIEQPVFPSTDALEATGKQFDVITLWHVFEHLYDVNASFAQLKRLLKPDGTLVLALPNRASADAGYYREYWAAYDVPRHLSHFTPQSIALLAEKHRMKIEKTLPMKLDAYYVGMMSEELKGRGKINAFLHGFWQGLRSNCQARKDGNYSSLIYIFHLEMKNK